MPAPNVNSAGISIKTDENLENLEKEVYHLLT
jgi:hypothetical protein